MTSLKTAGFGLIALITVASVAPHSADAAPAAPSPGRQWIAYQSPTWPPKVTLTQSRGVGTHSPTKNVPGGAQTNPDWSPDGRRLVFANAERDDGRENLWVSDFDGRNAHRLVDCVDACRWLDDPAWSPDGSRVLYSRMSETDGVSTSTLETARVADGHVDVLLTAESDRLFFSGQRWSPDGTKVVLEYVHKIAPRAPTNDDVDGVTLVAVDLTANPPTVEPIVDASTWPETPDWSPDGSEIVYAAFATPESQQLDLFVYDVQGRTVRQLTDLAASGGMAIHPDYTSGGDEVLFVAYIAESDSFGLARVQADAVRAGAGGIRPALGSTYVPGFHPRDRPTG